VSGRLHHRGSPGAKPQVEVVVEILAAIENKRCKPACDFQHPAADEL
jgi:hypothetical protein